MRIVAVLIVALLTAGCAAPLTPSHEPVAKQTTEAPTPTPVGKQTTEASTPTRAKAPVKLTGAAVSVPRRVIMEQLAKRAERIAASMASASPEVLPTDVNPNSNRGLGYRLMLQFGVAADQWQYLDVVAARVRLEPPGRERLLRCLWHPAVAAGLEDGAGCSRLAH